MFGFPAVFPLTKSSERERKRATERERTSSDQIVNQGDFQSLTRCVRVRAPFTASIDQRSTRFPADPESVPFRCHNLQTAVTRSTIKGHTVGIKEHSSGLPTLREHFLSHFQRLSTLVNLASFPQRRAFQFSQAAATAEHVNGFNGVEMSNSAAGC